MQAKEEFINWWEGYYTNDSSKTSGWKYWFNVDLDQCAIDALSELDSELRLVALSNIYSEDNLIKADQLNWDRVNYVNDLIVNESKYGTEKARILRALEMPGFIARQFLGMEPNPGAEHPVDNNYSAILCPQYPKLDIKYAHMVSLGTKPIDICQNLLSRKEAHDYFIKGGPSPYMDMTDNVNNYLDSLLPTLPYKLHYLEVLRWLIHQNEIGHWSILTKNRLLHGAYMGTFLEYVDEIEPDDLTHGLKTGIYHAFANSQDRIAADSVLGTDEIISENVFGKLPHGVNLLDTSNKLIHEGKFMHHCVGSYHRRVKERKSYIFAIHSYKQRSTLELIKDKNDWVVNQHRSFKNKGAGARHQKLINLWLDKINR
jgi:hypothetical protein